jgi:hypothetical protein
MAASRERLLFLLLAALAGSYVVLRAALVPWVHDECASLYWFVERGEFLPWKAHWDANNHVLSSAIGTAVYRLAGLGLFASRIGSVLAFAAYAWAAYHLGRRLQEPLVRWCLWAALLACPFVIEFFSLFRGYGLELAFWLVALEGLLRLVDQWRTRDLVITLAALFLANAAVLALLPIWALIVTALTFIFLRRWSSLPVGARVGRSTSVVLLGFVPLIVGALIAFALRERGLLYHGSTDGFRAVTVSSLLHYTFAAEGLFAHLLVGALAVLALLPLLFRVEGRGPLLVLALVLWAEVCARIAMAQWLGVNFPKDRAAVHLVPLFVLVLAYALDVAAQRKAMMRWGAIALLAFPLRALSTLNTSVTSIWPEQSVPHELLERMAVSDGALPPIIGAYHQLQLVVPYGARVHGLKVPPIHWEGFPHERYDQLLVDERIGDADRNGFDTITRAPVSGLMLMERARPLQWTGEVAYDIANPDPQQEFVELWRGDTLTDSLDRVLEVQGTLGSSGAFAGPELVATVKGPGGDLYYQPLPFALERPVWNGERFHRRILVPAKPEATSRVVYIWNVHRQPLYFEQLKITVSRGSLDTLR